jgi:hypothetical protein
MEILDRAKRICTAGFGLFLLAVLCVPGTAVFAQSQEPERQKSEVELLREKMQQLEQTVEGLKTQLKALEEAKKSSTQVASGEKVATDTSAPSTTVAPATEPATAAKPRADEPKGESSFQIYGFAMLDAGYQFKQNHPDWFDVIRVTKLPSFKDEFAPDGKVYYGVRQSRFGVKSSTPTKYGELKTQFEFELFGTGVDAGQTTFRLRHAYGELGPVGAGQYWSPFMDIDVFPNSLEYWGPTGMVFFRNVQVRWMPLKGKNAITIALERPGASGDQGRFADRIELQGIRPKFDLPDLSGNVRFTRNWGYFQAAGMLRRIKWVDTIDDTVDLGGQATSYGVNLTSNLKFSKNDTGRFAFTYGKGIENYMNDSPVDVGIELNPGGGPRRPIRGVALPITAMVAFLDHNWNKRFSSSVGYSFQSIDNSNGQAANAFHRGHYALGNLLFYPYDNVMIGGELQWGQRQNFLDGFKSDDVRIQFSFKYNFSKEFRF